MSSPRPDTVRSAHVSDPPDPSSDTNRQLLSETDTQDAASKLSTTPMFRNCHSSQLTNLAKQMHKVQFNRGDLIVSQNQNATRLLIIAEGYARQLRTESDGIERQVQLPAGSTTISELHVTSGDPVYASAKCVTQTCTAYAMSRAAFRNHLEKTPSFATQIIESLSTDVLEKTRRFRTPLLSQRTKEINFSAVTVASVVESYYRSALNALLNRRLSGISAPLFPNMHIQVPARVVYIAGFKSLRAFLDREIDPDSWNTHPSRVAVRFCKTIAPGIVMTPVSSILEASNVGHVNPDSLLRRAMSGTVPRLGREIIFGVGLNQLSDYLEERYRTYSPNALVANTAGSLSAGVIAGYFSHVPHNLSTYKLLNPRKSYGELFKLFVNKSVPDNLIPSGLPKSMLPFAKTFLACLIPRGILIRTVQICGSFALLNGIIHLVETDSRQKLDKVLDLDSVKEESTADEGVPVAKSRSEEMD